jgi:hypothetical protein
MFSAENRQRSSRGWIPLSAHGICCSGKRSRGAFLGMTSSCAMAGYSRMRRNPGRGEPERRAPRHVRRGALLLSLIRRHSLLRSRRSARSPRSWFGGMVLRIAHRVIRSTCFRPLRPSWSGLHPLQKTRMCILPHFHPSTVPDRPRRSCLAGRARPDDNRPSSCSRYRSAGWMTKDAATRSHSARFARNSASGAAMIMA